MSEDREIKKQDAFFIAIEMYKSHWFYRHVGFVISVLIISLQLISLLNLYQTYHSMNGVMLLLTFIAAYITTDFVNGLVHMYMDNNTNYTSAVGPFIAAFHLHHATPKYTKRHPIKIYFYESGSKFWLLVYLVILVLIQQKWVLNDSLNVGLVCFGILSSVAEVSHYWCHNAMKKNKIIKWLQKHGVLLSMQYHATHHTSDNVQYAFLNGITDPLINCIAHYYYEGYKNNADQHVAAYMARTMPTATGLSKKRD